jgi:hypothetical protein
MRVAPVTKLRIVPELEGVAIRMDPENLVEESPDERGVARAWRGTFLPRLLTAIAVTYFGCIWLDALGSRLPTNVLPSTLGYFVQVACLFPHAAETVIDYRVQGWDCRRSQWVEIDSRTDFPMNADNKENRFYRTLHFFRQNRLVMRALDAFLLDRHNGRARRGEDTAVIGGIRTLSLRLQIPTPGQKVSPYERRPLDSYPEAQRRYWYWTPLSTRAERCGDLDPGGS